MRKVNIAPVGELWGSVAQQLTECAQCSFGNEVYGALQFFNEEKLVDHLSQAEYDS
jgi:hypothetical protein